MPSARVIEQDRHCVANGIDPIGLTATEVIDAERQVINTWVSH